MVFGRKLFGGIRNAVGGALGNNMGQQQIMPYQPAIGMPGGQGGQTTYQNPNPQVGGPAQLGGNEFSTAAQPYSPSDARPTLLRPQMTMPYQPGDMGGGEYSPNPMGGFGGDMGGSFGGNMLSNMGNNTRLGNNMSNMPGNYGFGNMASPPPQTYEGYLASRGPMQQNVQLTQDQWQQAQDRTQYIPQQQIQGGMGQQLLQQAQAMQQARAMQQQGGMGQQPMALAGLLNTMPNQTPAGLAGLLGAVPTAPTASMAARPLSAMPRLPAKAPAVRPSMVRAAPKRAIKKLIKKR